MKVHFLGENSLGALKANLNGNLRHYADDTNRWVYEYFDSENPFIEYKQEFPDFQLTFVKADEDSLGKTDVDNIITLYSAMRTLTDTQASDERLWAGMCHSDFWGYMQQRWHVDDYRTLKETNVKARYFFSYDKRKSLITNSLSKLWWIGRL
ncbi:MAG: DUF6339 family protein, partial [Ruminococcus sp.]|nr:DUF6339 family protein [Ruminococcus sp.]